jgi:Fe-S-cluster-containing dehydrogenase component
MTKIGCRECICISMYRERKRQRQREDMQKYSFFVHKFQSMRILSRTHTDNHTIDDRRFNEPKDGHRHKLRQIKKRFRKG